METNGNLRKFKDIYKEEQVLIFKRREELDLEGSKDLLGIALSGGGIRSATFNLGLLEAFNRAGLLKRADYISTVSGGGYINSFIQNRLYSDSNFDNVFKESEIERLKRYGNYLVPYKGLRKVFEAITFYFTFVVLALLHIVWYILFFATLLLAVTLLFKYLPSANSQILYGAVSLLLMSFVWYYFMHPLRHLNRKLWSDRMLFYSFALLNIIAFVSYLSLENVNLLPDYLQEYADPASFVALTLTVLILGYFSNPNILSMHRYYRLRITDAYLKGSNVKVADLVKNGSITAPYPLICSTLNLQSDKELKGSKNCDYYLFSPLYCGSKLTKYVATNLPLYRRMTLGTAVTVSGAALNSMMGNKSNKFISFFLTLLNIRLGYWAVNPKILEGERKIDRMAVFFLYNGLKALPTYWPFYNLAELFGKMNLSRWMVNLSDGGGIENLGAYELFRRRVKVIICSDAGADPNYNFEDLRNLLLRVRNELQIAVEFDENNLAQEQIKPQPSSGYSKKHFVVGKYYKLAKEGEPREFIGYFIYIKATVAAPQYLIDNKTRSTNYYAYKNHHPAFPHEPTTDQFFDEVQWEAYQKLGREVGAIFLNSIKNCNKISEIENSLEEYLGKRV